MGGGCRETTMIEQAPTCRARAAAWAAALALMAAVVAAVGRPAAPVAAQVAPLIVNSTADPGTGGCDASECTLREAIAAANANPGADTIAFGILGAGPHTIVPESGLPPITDQVTIDGYTQRGAQANTAPSGTNARPMIEIDGSRAGNDGLSVFANASVVRGLVINRFSNDAIFVNADDVVVAGNFLGTDPSGTRDLGNGGDGVAINAGQALTVGGPDPADRNLVSGNGDAGLRVASPGATIQGNLVGTDRTGTETLGNDDDGIVVSASGVLVRDNLVAFNGRAGILLFPASTIGVRILANSIFANGGLGIDLLDANNGQVAPVITAATATERGVTIEGSLVGAPNRVFTLQFFTNPGARGAEGKSFLLNRRVTTEGDGLATFVVAVPRSRRVLVGEAITATATAEATGDSSEFSRPRPVRRERGPAPGTSDSAARPSTRAEADAPRG